MQRPLVQIRGAGHAPRLLVVAGKVLGTGGDALGLQRLHIGRAHLPGQDRILGEILEVPPAEGAALDVKARAQQHDHVLGLTFLAQRLAEPAHHVPVKGGGQRRGRGIADRFDALVNAQMVALALLLSQAVRAVAHHDGGHAQALDCLRVPEIPPGAEGGLFFQRHFH